MSDSPTAMKTPSMTPMKATPRKVTSESQNSIEPIRHSRIIAPMSASDRPAAMTTAARALAGKGAKDLGQRDQQNTDEEAHRRLR